MIATFKIPESAKEHRVVVLRKIEHFALVLDMYYCLSSHGAMALPAEYLFIEPTTQGNAQ